GRPRPGRSLANLFASRLRRGRSRDVGLLGAAARSRWRLWLSRGDQGPRSLGRAGGCLRPADDAPDIMAVAMARVIRGGELVFVGVNSPLPLVAATLARCLHAPNSTLLSIGGGFNPPPARLGPATSSAKLSAGSASVFDNVDFYGLVARRGVDLTFLGLGQLDERGRVNSSFIGERHRPEVRFPGGGGAATILPLARRGGVWGGGHSPRSFVQRGALWSPAPHIRQAVAPPC